ncbi:hypothetical protein AAVH_43488 [Aphelenchoides avenae]|nr:hypothetical protein AAVH_43488 [Aphelenchus avenae]
MKLLIAVVVLLFEQTRLVSSACPEFADWYNQTGVCALIYAGGNCTGPRLLLPVDGGIPDIRRELELHKMDEDQADLAALIRPLCEMTYYHDAEGKRSSTLVEDDGEPWLQPRSEVWSAYCECTLDRRNLLGNCIPTEEQVVVEQCNNFDSTDEIACVYTIRVGPSYSGYPADLDDDAESITAGEEGAFRRIISQKFPDRALDWPAQDNFTGSIAVPPYQLLRIKQRYFKCGDYYVWPTSEVVTDYVKQSRLVYSYVFRIWQ